MSLHLLSYFYSLTLAGWGSGALWERSSPPKSAPSPVVFPPSGVPNFRVVANVRSGVVFNDVFFSSD